MEGLKRKRRCQIQCKDHIFGIQSLKANSSKYDIKLQFCPKFQRQPLPPEHTYPEYNNDSKFYTSAFILGVDRRVLIKNEQQELMDHQKQIRDSLEKHNQLVFPRPNSKHSLCSVCKEHYKNYYLHISSEEHRERISLSLYNLHIKDLCNIYLDLWDGAEQRADQDAEKRAALEEERRQQLAEMPALENEEEEESLLDVQRGDNDDPNEEDDDADATYNAKPSKKYVKSNFKDDDTIPLTARPSKRAAPEGRVYTSEYLRKKFLCNNPAASQERAHREREQRRYQRERDKLKTERDNTQNKQFVKINEKEGDTFIIMKASHAVVQGHGEFVWKRTTDKLMRKDTEKVPERTERSEKSDLTPDKYEKENKKYEIEYGVDQKFGSRGPEQREVDKYDMRAYGYYPYPPPMSPYMMPEYKPENYKSGDHKFSEPHKAATSDPKALDEQKNLHEPHKNPEKEYKSMHPYYYNPYMYPPPIYEPYRSEKGYDYPPNEVEKPKNGEKPYDYPSMHYPMPYPHPYYMPPMQPLPPHQEQQATSSSKSSNSTASRNPYSTNTSININFPMYMCPPHPPMQGAPYSIPPSRYSSPPPPPMMHPPYMGYQYPYAPNQPNSGNREGEYPPSPNPQGTTTHTPPPTHQSHVLASQPPHPHPPPSPLPAQPPHQGSYHGYPPYMPQFPPPQYQYNQHPPSAPLHPTPSRA